MAIVYVNIGSNLGNRQALISKAIEKLGELFGFYCLSEFVETEPWGFCSTNRFLNVGIAFKSALEPENLLDELQKIEKEISEVAHRDSKGSYKDREIDIDIMDIEGVEYNSPRLQIPHRHLWERDFFIEPLRELRGH